mgnify:CR=1 FL=1
MSIRRFDIYGPASYSEDGMLVDYDDHNAIVSALKIEVQQLQADNKKKKNRIGILNRSLRRLKKE